jgi:hypothetical protein
MCGDVRVGVDVSNRLVVAVRSGGDSFTMLPGSKITSAKSLFFFPFDPRQPLASENISPPPFDIQSDKPFDTLELCQYKRG